MSSLRTYLDYNASAPLLPAVRDAVIAVLELDGNPSSVHAEGRKQRALIEDARAAIGRLVGADPGQVVLTSGASEANATVLRAGFDVALVADVEHDSVFGPLASSGARVVSLAVDRHGRVDLDGIRGAISHIGADRRGAARTVLALQAANNETGVVQPVAEAAAIAREAGIHVHCDAVQAVGRIPVDIAALGADTLAITAHKIGGPKGVGALIIRDGAVIQPLISGGGQEQRRRAGTENVGGVAGFGVAALHARQSVSRAAEITALRDRLEAGLACVTPEAVIAGSGAPRLPNTTNILLAGQSAEILLIKLDLAGFAVSSGAACSSGKVSASRVLTAMGVQGELARSAIRVSIGHATTIEEIDRFLAAWRSAVGGRTSGRHQSNPVAAADPISTRTMSHRVTSVHSAGRSPVADAEARAAPILDTQILGGC